MEQNSHRLIREHIVQQLDGGEAFIRIEDLLDEIEFEDLGKRAADLPYSFYEQFSHLRVSQHDILEFSRNQDYQPKTWPNDYWPVKPAPESEADWKKLKAAFFRERNEVMDLLLNEENALTVPFPHGDGQTLIREALLVLEHNAYHIGQLAIIFRLLNTESKKDGE